MNRKYDELVDVANELRSYYDIDKIKSYAVYIWTKGENSSNVFDILENEIQFYESHEISKDAMFIIKKIQAKIKEIRLEYSE